jgi:5-methyltetrahydropteroyltriglutamate--homocysteine methyltransferase
MRQRSHEPAGDVELFQDKDLGQGVASPRTEKIESPDGIKRSADRALKLYSSGKLFLNLDCGFGTFSSRPVNSSAIASDKLKSIVHAARAMREYD